MDQELRLLTQEEAAQFAAQVAQYKPNDNVIEQFAASNFGVIAGPTGAGKDTLRNALLELRPSAYRMILSTTTRPPRELEAEGVDYYFKPIAFMKEGLAARRFLQAAVVHDQQISCLDYADIEEIGVGETGLAILVVQTEIELRKINPNIKTVFLTAPDLSTLKHRITEDRLMSYEEVERRLRAARDELKIALEHPEYYCVINDDLIQTRDQLDNFFVTGARSNEADAKARLSIQALLNELSA